jgi:hypothetical protein
MLPSHLNTNEVRGSDNAEVEYLRMSVEGRKVVFHKSGESPALKDRITFQHEEKGVGPKSVRRSNLSNLVEVTSDVDDTSTAQIIVSTTIQVPIGLLSTNTAVVNAMCKHTSLLATVGTSGVYASDGSGNGAKALTDGTL